MFELNRKIYRLGKDKSRVDLAIRQLDSSIMGLEKFRDRFLTQLKYIQDRKLINRLKHT